MPVPVRAPMMVPAKYPMSRGHMPYPNFRAGDNALYPGYSRAPPYISPEMIPVRQGLQQPYDHPLGGNQSHPMYYGGNPYLNFDEDQRVLLEANRQKMTSMMNYPGVNPYNMRGERKNGLFNE